MHGGAKGSGDLLSKTLQDLLHQLGCEAAEEFLAYSLVERISSTEIEGSPKQNVVC
jgi:hypothetical protein